jgi:hypothetical protein
VRPHQLQRDWILRRAFRVGRSLYSSEQEAQFGRVPMLLGIPRWRIGKYLRALMEYGLAKLKGNFDDGFTARWDMRLFEGYLFERGQFARSLPPLGGLNEHTLPS